MLFQRSVPETDGELYRRLSDTLTDDDGSRLASTDDSSNTGA